LKFFREGTQNGCVPLCVRRTQVPYTAVHNASRTQKWAPDFSGAAVVLPSEPVVILCRDRLSLVQEEPGGSFLDAEFFPDHPSTIPIFQVLLQYFAIERVLREPLVDVGNHPVTQIVHFGFLVSGLLAFQNRVFVPADGFALIVFLHAFKEIMTLSVNYAR